MTQSVYSSIRFYTCFTIATESVYTPYADVTGIFIIEIYYSCIKLLIWKIGEAMNSYLNWPLVEAVKMKI